MRSFTCTAITADGIASLAGMSELRELDLERMSLGDDGLKHLAGLKNLRKLNIGGTKITPAGREKIAKLLPKVVVTP